MKISSLDFLSDLEKRLLAAISCSGALADLCFRRILNFSEKTILLEISLGEHLLGRLNCRMVEEPQDFYFRGTFQPTSGGGVHPFTLRPESNYEKEIELLVKAISGFAVAGTQMADIAVEPAIPAAPSEPSSVARRKPKGTARGSIAGSSE